MSHPRWIDTQWRPNQYRPDGEDWQDVLTGVVLIVLVVLITIVVML